jgi:hypothetical protein
MRIFRLKTCPQTEPMSTGRNAPRESTSISHPNATSIFSKAKMREFAPTSAFAWSWLPLGPSLRTTIPWVPNWESTFPFHGLIIDCRGTFGEVYEVTHMRTQQLFAAKILKPKELGSKEDQYCEREVGILRNISHVSTLLSCANCRKTSSSSGSPLKNSLWRET